MSKHSKHRKSIVVNANNEEFFDAGSKLIETVTISLFCFSFCVVTKRVFRSKNNWQTDS